MKASTKNNQADRWKLRGGPAGLHLFNRTNGMNVLFDEISVPASLHSRTPRHVSIALTNRCDLACDHCFVPNSHDELCFDVITRWLAELDSHGTLAVGFGGGEPTLYPAFEKLCKHVARETMLSVSFTTHGHNIDDVLAEGLRGSVNFVRVSMDGVGATYESIRRRSFSDFLSRLENVKYISRFGINIVINERTLPDLDEAAAIAADVGACELLLLPQMSVRSLEVTSAGTLQKLRRWVNAYRGPLKLCINEEIAEGFPICDPLSEERGLCAYAHIDAMGVLKHSSYSEVGIPLSEGGVLQALNQLSNDLTENNI